MDIYIAIKTAVDSFQLLFMSALDDLIVTSATHISVPLDIPFEKTICLFESLWINK